MKRPASTSRTAGGIADEVTRAPAALRGLLEDRELDEIERSWPDGMTSRQIVDVFETRGIRFSEATLRKYVQLGLLPRSVRVGRKGKHRGSCGLYPAHVIRRVNVVKGMMAQDRTIEESQADQRLRARGEGTGRRRGWTPRAGTRDHRGEARRRRVGPPHRQPRATDFCTCRTIFRRLHGRRRERSVLTVAERPTEEECHG